MEKTRLYLRNKEILGGYKILPSLNNTNSHLDKYTLDLLDLGFTALFNDSKSIEIEDLINILLEVPFISAQATEVSIRLDNKQSLPIGELVLLYIYGCTLTYISSCEEYKYNIVLQIRHE